jgi:hypothetical protein
MLTAISFRENGTRTSAISTSRKNQYQATSTYSFLKSPSSGRVREAKGEERGGVGREEERRRRKVYSTAKRCKRGKRRRRRRRRRRRGRKNT